MKKNDLRLNAKKMQYYKKMIYCIFLLVTFCFYCTPAFCTQPTIGLALGMGGERFFIHIGVLKVLEEEGIKVDYLSGTSSGAFVAGLYALWEDIQRIEILSLNIEFKKYYKYLNEIAGFKKVDDTSFLMFYIEVNEKKFNPKWLKGLVDTRIIRDEIDLLTNRASFEYDLKIPFAAIAVNLENGEKVVIDHGRISNAIAASMARPGTCIPFQYQGMMLVDGALVDPLPIDVLKEMGADIVIGVDLSGIRKDRSPVANNVLSIVSQSIDIMLESLSKAKSSHADIVIKPEYSGVFNGIIDSKERLYLMSLGEKEARKIIPALKERIATYSMSNEFQ